MNTARLSARWQGHQVGSLVYGADAAAAVKAGVAVTVDQPAPRKITTGASADKPAATRKRTRRTSSTSPTREPSTEETSTDDDNGTGDQPAG